MAIQTKICGILGGLGPSATVDLFRAIVAKTPADVDQEHLHIVINNNPRIPDRTNAIMAGTKEPVAGLVNSAQILKNSGADFIAIPCNTAHYFIKDIQAEVDLPVLDMIAATAVEIKKQGFKKVGLISTSATVQVKLYESALQAEGVELVVPSPEGIKKEMEVIYGERGVKAGTEYERSLHNKRLILEVISELYHGGAEAIIMGCTEIPLTILHEDTDIMLINPTEILAAAIVEECTS